MRFGRSNDPTSTSGSRRRSSATMSRRTRSVAVAVKACSETAGKSSRSRPSRRYSGLKSCPHWLMQCASSMAMKRRPACCSSRRKMVTPLAHQPFRRHVQQSAAVLAEARQDGVPLGGLQRAVQVRCRHAVDAQAVDLILHQRNQRRHDQRHAATRRCRRPGRRRADPGGPAPESRSICRPRSAERRRCRATRESPASPRAATDGSWKNPRRGGERPRERDQRRGYRVST